MSFISNVNSNFNNIKHGGTEFKSSGSGDDDPIIFLIRAYIFENVLILQIRSTSLLSQICS
jgi:hypothetical protein